MIRELKGWIEELETGKAWLEEQRANWQAQAAERERVVQEQQAWIGELEQGKAWLEAQRAAWQTRAEHWQTRAEHWQGRAEYWQTSRWGRLGLGLKLVNPAQALPDQKLPDQKLSDKESEPDD